MQRTTEAIQISPRLSLTLGVWVVTAHLVATWAVLLLIEVTLWLKLLMLGMLALSFVIETRRHIFHRGAASIREARWVSDGKWHLQLRDGSSTEAELLPSSFVKPWLVVLHFRCVGVPRRRSLVLLADSLDRAAARRLRVRLLQGRARQESVLGK